MAGVDEKWVPEDDLLVRMTSSSPRSPVSWLWVGGVWRVGMTQWPREAN